MPNAGVMPRKVVRRAIRSGGVNFDIGSLSMESEHEWKPILDKDYLELDPQISPDGRWMAYASNEGGRMEIFVRPYPEVDKGKWQVSTNGGEAPRWSPDGRELFYLGSDSLMAVSVETDPKFKPGKPESLFQITNYRELDIHPNRKRFLMTKLEEDESTGDRPALQLPRKINIVVNRFEELKERIPVE